MKHRFKLMLLTFLFLNIACKENKGGVDGSLGPAPDEASPVTESPDREDGKPDNTPVKEPPTAHLNGTVNHILHLNDGSLIVYGEFNRYGEHQTSGLIKLDEKRQLQQSFSSNIKNFSGQVHGVKELQGGLIALYGYRIAMNHLPESALLIIDSDAQPFSSMISGDAQRIEGEIFDLEQDTSGNLHLAGNFKAMTNGGIANLAVLNLKGQLMNNYRKINSEQEKVDEIVEEIKQHIANAPPTQQVQEPKLDPLPKEMDLILDEPRNYERAPASTPDSLSDFEQDINEEDLNDEFVSDASHENQIDDIIDDDDDSEIFPDFVTVTELNSFLSVYKESYKKWATKKASLLKLRKHKKRVKNNLKLNLKLTADKNQKKQLKARWKAYKESYKKHAKVLKKQLAVLKNQFKAQQKTLKKFAKANKKALKKQGVQWKDIKTEMKFFKKDLAQNTN